MVELLLNRYGYDPMDLYQHENAIEMARRYDQDSIAEFMERFIARQAGGAGGAVDHTPGGAGGGAGDDGLPTRMWGWDEARRALGWVDPSPALLAAFIAANKAVSENFGSGSKKWR